MIALYLGQAGGGAMEVKLLHIPMIYDLYFNKDKVISLVGVQSVLSYIVALLQKKVNKV